MNEQTTKTEQTEMALDPRTKERAGQSQCRKEFEQARLTGKEVALLTVVRAAKQPPTCEDVAHELGCSTNQVAGAVSVLIAKGWLQTERVKRDGRKRRVLSVPLKDKLIVSVTKSGKHKADGVDNPNGF